MPNDINTAHETLAALRATMLPALRLAIRNAKAELTIQARALDAARRAHTRALRSESRARPLWISPDSDAATDALSRALDRYNRAASNLDALASEYRRNYNSAR